jgi:phosphoribosylglycinamide formyltransferase-1
MSGQPAGAGQPVGAAPRSRLGVLASGSGSNLQALLDACASGRLAASVAVVICNVPGARCLDRARLAGVPAVVLPHKPFPSREAFDAALVAALREHGVDTVCLAGFMRVVTPVLLSAFPDRVVNVHPALLPSFPGMHGLRQALAAGVRITGCSVHLVDEGTDTGPILVQAAVPVLEGDTEETLHARVQPLEHQAYLRAVGLLIAGRFELVVEGGRRRARLRGGDAGPLALGLPAGTPAGPAPGAAGATSW